MMAALAAWTLPHSFAEIGRPAWIGLFYVSLFSMLIGFIFWYRGLAQGGIAAVGQLQLLQPFFGLALAGFDAYLQPARILVFGESEIRYLENLDAPARTSTLRQALALDFPCILITGGFVPPPEMMR